MKATNHTGAPVAAALLAVGLLAAAGCSESPVDVVQDQCRKGYSAEVCGCVVTKLKDNPNIGKIAESLKKGGAAGLAAAAAVEAAALACRAAQ